MIFTKPVRRKVEEAPGGPITDGLVLHYPMNENGGAVLGDVSGGGHDADIIGSGYSWVPGFEGSALYIADGRNHHGENQSFSADGYPEVSLCIRAKATHSFGNLRTFFHLQGSDTNSGCSLQHTTGVLQFNTRTSVYQSVTYSSGWRDGEWHSLIGTYDGSLMRLYYDGVDQGQQAQSGSIENPPTQKLYIGVSIPGSVFLFDTTIDDLRVYDRALTPAECAQIAAGTG